MTYKWTFALAASVALMGAATAQESSPETAKDLEETIEQAVDDEADAVEPEIEISEQAEVADQLSVADYEASQTGGVVDAQAAAEAMVRVDEEPSQVVVEVETVTEDLVPADELDSVAMDSDEVALARNVDPGDIVDEHEELGDEAQDIGEEVAEDLLESANIPDDANEKAIGPAEEFIEITEESDEIIEDVVEPEPTPASDAVSNVLEEAGVNIVDE